ncbi:MAG: hypothetical protein ACKPJO_08425 [Dolichospermum sp.]
MSIELYESPAFSGKIRNLRQDGDKFHYQIFINEELITEGFVYSNDRDYAIKLLKAIGEDRRKEIALKHELEVVGDQLYVKWFGRDALTKYGLSIGLEGYYGVCFRGKEICMASAYDHQDLESALTFMRKQRKTWVV